MYRVWGLPGFSLDRGAEPANDLPLLRPAGTTRHHSPEPEPDEPAAAHGCDSKRAEPAPTARGKWWSLLLRRKLHASQACRGEHEGWKAGRSARRGKRIGGLGCWGTSSPELLGPARLLWHLAEVHIRGSAKRQTGEIVAGTGGHLNGGAGDAEGADLLGDEAKVIDAIDGGGVPRTWPWITMLAILATTPLPPGMISSPLPK